MLGIVLLYVGAVLLLNGVSSLGKSDAKSTAIMNLFTGGIAFIINIINLSRATTPADFYGVGTGLLFAFTYLYVAAVNWYELDGRSLGWYCWFVAITTLPCAYMSFLGGDLRFTVIWLLWGALWYMFYMALAAGRNLGNWLAYASIFVGVFTCWIPGYLMLINKW
ncbi:MAG: AmiS/UreI family transporter [Negativicutes bacterium]